MNPFIFFPFQSQTKWLTDLKVGGSLMAAIVGAFVGFLFVLWLLPVDFLLGKSGSWWIGDPGSHVSALRAFLNDIWRLPPLNTINLNYPEGINIAFADIIPVAALPTKVISPWLPDNFHYFGYWVVLAYTSQGVISACLLYQIDFKRLIWLVPGTVIFLLSPAMLFRVNAHIALTTHAYILCALLIYILQIRQQWNFWNLVYTQAVLGCLSLLTHPYLYAMIFPVFAAGLIDCARCNGHSMKIVPALLLAIIPIMILLLTLGYINGKQVLPAGGSGYGTHSMNLVSPFIGGGIIDIPIWTTNKYMLCDAPAPYDATGGQYEGYNHLGLGVLAAFLATIVLRWRWVLGFFYRNIGLSIIMLGLFFYAISNRIYFADQLLISIELPRYVNSLADQFRSSGRFFWPVAYVITLIVLKSIIKIQSKWVATLCIAFVMIAQIVDTTPLRNMTRLVASRPIPNLLLDDPWWQNRIQKTDALYVFPTFGCGARTYEDILPLQQLATFNHIPFNTGTIARDYSPCAEKESVFELGLKKGCMYIFLADHYTKKSLNELFGQKVIESRCIFLDLGCICGP